MIAFACAMVFGFVACGDDEEDDKKKSSSDDVTLEVSSKSFDFSAKAGEETVSIKADGSWKITCDAEWVTVFPKKGTGDKTVSISTEANTGSARQATVTVTLDDVTKEIVIKQSGAQKEEDPKEETPEGLTSIKFASETVSAYVGSSVGVYLKSTGAQLKLKENFERVAKLEIVTDPEDFALESIKLTSSDESIATIENGVVNCLAAGTVTITASVGSLSATCSLSITTSNTDKDFLMYVEDLFTITGDPERTVVTGKVSYGKLKVGETVRIAKADGTTLDVPVYQLEMFKKLIDETQAGDNVGIAFLASDLAKTDLSKGDALISTNSSYKNTTKFVADIYFNTKDEGGRYTAVPANYRPQLFLGTTDRTCSLNNAETIELGTTVTDVEIEAISSVVALVGSEFTLREGGRTVATGVIKEVK